MGRRAMPISSWWLQAAILTYAAGFTALGILAYLVYEEQPPLPGRVVAASGERLFGRKDIRGNSPRIFSTRLGGRSRQGRGRPSPNPYSLLPPPWQPSSRRTP